jgi:murein DD-endopeptidase MepM/ murein hydrolase activator NlpD
MSTLKRYKDMEKRLYRKGTYAVSTAGKGFASAWRSFLKAGSQKTSIMFIPHSEKKTLNLQISGFALVGICVLIGVGVLGLFMSVLSLTGLSNRLVSKTDNLRDTQRSLDSMRDEASRLMKAAKKFEATLNETLGAVGVEAENAKASAGVGDLASFFANTEGGRGHLEEVAAFRDTTDYLERSTEQVKLLGQLYGSKYALNFIPTVWPIKSGLGLVSMYFGQNKNPFTNMWYIHKGLDINTRGSGDPVCATANGEVIQVAFEPSYGNFITIKHQFGFYTRYAHLQLAKVLKGQKVQQGQIIGYLGNTGLTTGPHLHYEIHLGTDVVDPLKYLNRPKPEADAPAGNR